MQNYFVDGGEAYPIDSNIPTGADLEKIGVEIEQIKPKKLLKLEERQKLLNNIKNLKKIGYSDQEIAIIIGEKHKQVVSSIFCLGLKYNISLKKCLKINNLIKNHLCQ